jgi:hypothetical protein
MVCSSLSKKARFRNFQWHLPIRSLRERTPVQNYQWAIDNPLNLKSAWNAVRGTSYIADLDNGIQNGNPNSNPATPLHEDLGQPWRPVFNFNVAGGNDVDEHPELGTGQQYAAGHGTHTAGIIAAATTQASVAPAIRTLPSSVAPGSAGIAT